MKYFLILIFTVPISTTFLSCKKDNSDNKCSSNTTTVRVISNQQATIRLIGGTYYVIEDGTIDTKLVPCELSPTFQVDNLRVTVSGDVKLTVHNAGMPCCLENFVITNIIK